MKTEKNLKDRFGIFRSFGWKKNLLAAAAGFLICVLLDVITAMLFTHNVIGTFNLSVAVIPMLGLLMGIWGVLGYLVKDVFDLVRILIDPEMIVIIGNPLRLLLIGAADIVYCILPAILWYALPLKGEKRAEYPRLDTSGHVIKYYLIMLADVIVYVAIMSVGYYSRTLSGSTLGSLAVLCTQYLDVILIFGMPTVILVSLIRRRTLTINERMVLAFLTVGVAASVLCAALLYRNTLYLAPEMFEEYESVLSSESGVLTNQSMAVINRFFAFLDWYYVILAIMLNSLLILEMLLMRSIEKKVTRPILHLTDVLEKYTETEENVLNSENVKQECQPYRYGYGEVSTLTRTCINMVDEIDDYTENLQKVTAERQRIGTELDVASNIQRDMLPSIFPPFPDRCEVDLFASMDPAKEVGGDFYDFYLIDHDHLALTIADVSDKGVPASLFMVISKTLLQNHAQTGGSPKEIMTYVNHQLCQNNESFMFCTAWLGILNLTNGRLIASNAGHEYPAIRRADGQFELMKDVHDPPLGVRDGLRFKEYEMTMYPGDCLFQYTDGVTEAINQKEELFGDKRLVMTLNAKKDLSPKELIEEMHEAIRDFSKGVPQSDDITMLCVQFLGPDIAPDGKHRAFLEVPARRESMDEVNMFLEAQLDEVACPPDSAFLLMLAAEEIFVNIASYAYDGGEGDARIEFSFDEEKEMAELVFSDRGIPFDPTSRPSPDITLKSDDRPIGGLGIHIIKQRMDEVDYQYAGGKNVLTIRKYLHSAP